MIVLFDFDGVIADTETQYSTFWDKTGMDYLGMKDFGHTIKGQTLVQIFAKYFDGMQKAQEEILPRLNEFERNMSYDYIPGALEFMKSLKEAGIPMAIVTSSNDVKMANAYKAHPELLELVDKVLTSEHFSKSKPDPEVFIKAAEYLDVPCDNCLVVEDATAGIDAAKAGHMYAAGIGDAMNYSLTDYPLTSFKDLLDICK
jgi:HAD superfamily hydrolase (TIGR01509 family)